jgi:hypothetical protein
MSLLQRQPSIRDAVSLDTLLEDVFAWLWETRHNGPTVPLCEHILEKCEARVSDQEVIVPIFGLHVEIPVVIGRVGISDITEQEMADWRERMVSQAPQQGRRGNAAA